MCTSLTYTAQRLQAKKFGLSIRDTGIALGLTLAPSPFNISINKPPASSPSSDLTSTKTTQPLRILCFFFPDPPEPFVSCLLLSDAPGVVLPCASFDEAGVVELADLNPVRVPGTGGGPMDPFSFRFGGESGSADKDCDRLCMT